MALVHAGYRGIAAFSALTTPGYVRFSDGAISAKQGINAPDLIGGDWDHDAYNYEKVTVDGTMAGPATETFAAASGGLLKWAVGRNSCGLLTPSDIDLYYYCDNDEATGFRHQNFTGLYANSITFSCTAGDVATWNMALVGKSAGAFDATNPPNTPGTQPPAEKLITWDKTSLVMTASTDINEGVAVAFNTFEFTVANNISPQYAIVSTDQTLMPYEMVPAMRTITGSFTVFDIKNIPGVDHWDDYTAGNEGTLVFSIGDTPVTLKCRFARIDPKISVGPIMSTVAFVGVTHQSGDPWDT